MLITKLLTNLFLIFCYLIVIVESNDEELTTTQIATTSNGAIENIETTTILNTITTTESDEEIKAKAEEIIKSMRRMPIRRRKISLKSRTLFTNGWRAIAIPKFKFSKINLQQQPNKNDDILKPSSTSPSPPIIESVKIEVNNVETTGTSSTTETPKMDISIKNETYSECTLDGKQYANGENIPNLDDPCTYCRCFYGQKMCQEQKCPPVPSPDCIAEKNANQCCPLYTCKTMQNEPPPTEEGSPSNIEIINNKVDQSPIRRGPQYIGETANIEEKSIKPENVAIHSATPPIENKNDFEGKLWATQAKRRISLPMDPLEMIYNNPIQNRIHFPNNNSNRPKNFVPPTLGGIDSLAASIFNRQLFEMLTKENMKPNVAANHKPDNDQPTMVIRPIPVAVNSSPIRTLPQSPTQLNKLSPPPMEPSVNNESIMISETVSSERPPIISTTAPLLSTKGIELPNIFQVSGCNIYGKMYKTDEEIKELSNQCKTCICASTGVKCLQNC